MAGCGCVGGSCISTRCSCRRSGQACGALCGCSQAADVDDGANVAGPSACTNTLHALLQQQAPRLRRPGISVPADLLRPYSRQPVRGGRRPPDSAAAVQAAAGAAAATIAAAALPPHTFHHLHDLSSRDSGASTSSSSSSSSSGSARGDGSARGPHPSANNSSSTTNRHVDFIPTPRPSSNNADFARPIMATQHHQQQHQQRQRPAPPCRYFAAGCCRFGAECIYSHDQAAANRPIRERPETPVCVYFVSGNCRNGDSCMFRHVYATSTSSEQQQAPAAAAAFTSTTPTPCAVPDNIGTVCASEDEGPDTCGVCFEDVQKAKKRFGLLTECDHCFCLECLRTWRQREGQELSVVRSCPACRKLSHFVVPSATFCKGEEKQRVIAVYKATLARQPCRYYQSSGTCRFGPHCFYAHVDSDGTDAKPKQAQDWTKRAERRRRREEQAQQQRRRALSAAHAFGAGTGAMGDGSTASDVSNTFQRMLEMLEELYSETDSVSESLSQGDWLEDEDYGYSSEELLE